MRALAALKGAASRYLVGLAIVMAPSMSSAADTLPSLIAKFKPSVLAVGFYKETQSPRFGFSGTGFIVGDGNLLVTNAHVIARATKDDADAGSLVVYTPGASGQDSMRSLEVIEIDKAHDLALLRFEGSALPVLTLGAAQAAREGQMVAFIGFPLGSNLGLSPVTHRGIVSAITTVALPSPSARQLDSRAIKALKDGAFDLLQLDATAYPGNSGGPVFDAETGAVVGVINMVALKGTRESALTHPSGISYAIPVEHVLRLLARNERK
ncbi:MAG: serine protease [Burkholderiales bacterium PBB1]|nr:MAG: serine protease [Burkholderiales bacterium PBB1]